MVDINELELSDEAEYEICRLENDAYGCVTPEIFFYGQLIHDDMYHDIPPEEEGAFYTQCPECGKIHMLDIEWCFPGNDYECPYCHHMGTLHNFHDRDDPLDNIPTSRYAWLDAVENGYVVRLFEAGLDYSERDYSDYSTLEFYPNGYVFEIYREVWVDGEVSYWKWDVSDYKRIDEKIYDGDYWLIGLGDLYDYVGAGYCNEIAEEAEVPAANLIEFIANTVSLRTLSALCKYGFEKLEFEYPFRAKEFPDSTKISEILGVDYNQVIARLGREEVSVEDILNARKLREYGVELSEKNVYIMSVIRERHWEGLSQQNASKTLKYLRNQIGRAKTPNTAYTVRDYIDYITDCEKLGYDMNSGAVRYPTDLVVAHQATMTLVQITDAAAFENAIRTIYEKYHHLLEWSDGIYCLIMPQSAQEIIEEGARQDHCVGKYAERMANGEDFILFLRKSDSPNENFYTVELKPDVRKYALVQCRGYHNEDSSEEIRAAVDIFLAKYAAWFNSRKVTDAPYSTICTYYKAVKKMPDGKYISAWDNKTEYVVGREITTAMCEDPDRVAVPGIHVASLGFAMKYGDGWHNAAILEIEVDMHDVVIPDAKDQIRTSRGFVKREVPYSELGEWGERHQKMTATLA